MYFFFVVGSGRSFLYIFFNALHRTWFFFFMYFKSSLVGAIKTRFLCAGVLVQFAKEYQILVYVLFVYLYIGSRSFLFCVFLANTKFIYVFHLNIGIIFHKICFMELFFQLFSGIAIFYLYIFFTIFSLSYLRQFSRLPPFFSYCPFTMLFMLQYGTEVEHCLVLI